MLEKQTLTSNKDLKKIILNAIVRELDSDKYPKTLLENEFKEQIYAYYVPNLIKSKGIFMSYKLKGKRISFILIRDDFAKDPENNDELNFVLHHELGHFTLHLNYDLIEKQYPNYPHNLMREIEANIYSALKTNKQKALIILKKATINYKRKIIIFNNENIDMIKKQKILKFLFMHYFSRLIPYYYIKYLYCK